MEPLTLDEFAALDESLELDPDGPPVSAETFRRLAALVAQEERDLHLPRRIVRVLIDAVAEEWGRGEG